LCEIVWTRVITCDETRYLDTLRLSSVSALSKRVIKQHYSQQHCCILQITQGTFKFTSNRNCKRWITWGRKCSRMFLQTGTTRQITRLICQVYYEPWTGLGVWKNTCNLEVTYVTTDTTPCSIVNGDRVAWRHIRGGNNLES
jgi:hypothetical protein